MKGEVLEREFREVFWHFESNEVVPITRNTGKDVSKCKGRREFNDILGMISGVTIFNGKEQGLVVNGAL